uniref:Uncharacterized protein n=1 Tax=Romanomermis culicivorax TaxID=13658 RepID=A0A915J457_ROMCU
MSTTIAVGSAEDCDAFLVLIVGPLSERRPPQQKNWSHFSAKNCKICGGGSDDRFLFNAFANKVTIKLDTYNLHILGTCDPAPRANFCKPNWNVKICTKRVNILAIIWFFIEPTNGDARNKTIQTIRGKQISSFKMGEKRSDSKHIFNGAPSRLMVKSTANKDQRYFLIVTWDPGNLDL